MGRPARLHRRVQRAGLGLVQGGRESPPFIDLATLAAVAGRRSLVLDGEIVALSGPRPDFTLLQRPMLASRPGAGLLAAVPVTLIIFDVMRSGRDHLAGSPYVLRRALSLRSGLSRLALLPYGYLWW